MSYLTGNTCARFYRQNSQAQYEPSNLKVLQMASDTSRMTPRLTTSNFDELKNELNEGAVCFKS